MRTAKTGLYLSLALNFLLIAFLFYKKYETSFISSKTEIKSNSITYKEYRRSVIDSLSIDSASVLFVGDSFVEGFELQEVFQTPIVYNRGVNGDKLVDVWFRLGEILRSKPSKIFLSVGINDLQYKTDTDSVAHYFKEVLQKCKTVVDSSNIFVCSVFPVADENTFNVKNEEVEKFNTSIYKIRKEEAVSLIDVTPYFKSKKDLYFKDGIHLNGKGYAV